MKKISIFLLTLLAFSACNKEEPSLEINITPSTLNPDSGETVQFNIEGNSDFLVYYTGLQEQKYEDYPNAVAQTINMLSDQPTFTYKYNYHGSLKGVFVASSYGNWGEDKIEKIIKFDFNVVDNNANISSVILKTSGLFGTEFVGVINTETETVTVTMPSTTNITKLTTNVVPKSARSEIYLDGQLYENKSQLDFSSGEKTFKLIAIGGAEKNWTVKVILE